MVAHIVQCSTWRLNFDVNSELLSNDKSPFVPVEFPDHSGCIISESGLFTAAQTVDNVPHQRHADGTFGLPHKPRVSPAQF